MLKTANAYLNLYAVLRNDPRQAGSNEIRIALTQYRRPKFLTILINLHCGHNSKQFCVHLEQIRHQRRGKRCPRDVAGNQSPGQ